MMNCSWLAISVSVSDSSEESNSENEVESSEEDVEADAENIASDEEKSVLMANEGWGDSVAKILGSKKPKNKKTLVLSRAKKHSDIVKSETVEKPSFEVIGESTEKKPDVKTLKTEDSEPPAKKVVSILHNMIMYLFGFRPS